MELYQVKWLLHQTNKAYGLLTLIGYVWVLLNLKFKRHVINPFADGHTRFICSELAACVLGMANPENATPQNVLEFLRGY